MTRLKNNPRCLYCTVARLIRKTVMWWQVYSTLKSIKMQVSLVEEGNLFYFLSSYKKKCDCCSFSV